jgi:hypothetical protein
VRRWPWGASLVAAAVVDLCIGAARHFDFAGIEGFSTTNYGWLAFGFVGGVGFAWRLARPRAGAWLFARWLAAPALVFVGCFLLVTITALVFLPDQSLGKTLTTDALGRAFWLSVLVALASAVSELWWVVVRARRQQRDSV